MSEMQPNYDAVLVHGYWFSQKGDHTPVRPSLRSHIAARAAAKVYDEGRGAGAVVLGIGHNWGPEYPALDDLVEKKMFAYGVPAEKIHKLKARGTTDEINRFLELCHEQNWTNVADIAARLHSNMTIPILYTTNRPQVDFLAAEDILKYDEPRVVRIVKRLNRSTYEVALFNYELMKRALIELDQAQKLADMAKKDRGGKKHLFVTDRFLPMDKYNL